MLIWRKGLLRHDMRYDFVLWITKLEWETLAAKKLKKNWPQRGARGTKKAKKE